MLAMINKITPIESQKDVWEYLKENQVNKDLDSLDIRISGYTGKLIIPKQSISICCEKINQTITATPENLLKLMEDGMRYRELLYPESIYPNIEKL